ncbi:uncharacterized protein FIBRA_08366 [Fibroporia radiculosa]|uniref:Nephrocystin 3-like N-terminal domain-containing protein n=1 Tax=Fibroporia radiculosa TaxID=599839 RepID=J4I2M0_9APHY|nr:uncharacterized protein FIBRA_08366 [Fibroporia radiculosa]CCM06117.1 predicted protein [Fibroporia radiculosa]
MSKDNTSSEKRKFRLRINRASLGKIVAEGGMRLTRSRYLDLLHLPFGRSRSPTPVPSSSQSVSLTVPVPHHRPHSSASIRDVSASEDGDPYDPMYTEETIIKPAESLTLRDSEDAFDGLRVNANNRLGDMQSSKLSDMLKPLKAFSSVAESIAELDLYAQLALGILVCASEAIRNQEKRDGDVKNLCLKISDVYSLLTMRKEQAADRAMGRVLVNLVQQSYWLRLLKNIGKDTDAVIGEYNAAPEDHVQRFRDRNALQTTLFMYRIGKSRSICLRACRTLNDDGVAEDVSLNNMEYANGVSLNISEQCLEGTRTDILLEIKHWMSSTKDGTEQVMWLSGMAGKGKSAIAHTIASWAEASGVLGSCFCFDRTREGGHLYQKIFTTIARDLADHDPLVRRALADVIRDSNELRHTSDMQRQWDKLVVGPTRAASKVVGSPVLIVIDALDESGGWEIRQDFLRTLTGRRDKPSPPTTELPPNVRILVTSRPLPDIQDALKGIPHIRYRSLDDVPQESSERDVECYIADKLKSRMTFQGVHFRVLAQKSDGVFEWARLACSYIMDDSSMGPDATGRFNSLVTRGWATDADLLDDMYTLVLQVAMQKNRRRSAISLFRSVMGQIISSSEPLSMVTLSAIRQQYPSEDTIQVEPIIRSLSALLTSTLENVAPVRPLHASFYDFLMDETRSGEFHVETSEA